MTTVLALLLAYVIGSVPFAYLVGRLAGRDLLKEGSGGVSSVAAIERVGTVWGAIAGLADALKPVAAIFVAQQFATYEVSAAAGVMAVVGHVWPFTLRFRGGRGVAPAGGALAALGSWHMVLALVGLALSKAIVKDAAPGALLGFLVTAIVLSLTGADITLSLTGWTLLGVLIVARLVGYRKSKTPDNVATATRLWWRFLLDRDEP